MHDPVEHAFAQYIRALGKGKQGSRSLSFDEARDAMRMILHGQVQDVQIGAFLMLLRVKEESADEIAGFVSACREAMLPDRPAVNAVAFDWSSYAGKRRQPHWFLLAAVLLAQNGYRVFMHGAHGHTAGRVYTQDVCQSLALPIAHNWTEASAQLDQHNFTFMPIEHLCPPLHQLIQLRPLFGLRSPVHTLCRLLNPLSAHTTLQSVFHPAYANTHHSAAQQLGETNAVVFKGDAGEVECRPHARLKLHALRNGESIEASLPKTCAAPAPIAAGSGIAMDIDSAAAQLLSLWQRQTSNDYAQQAVLGTLAIALYTAAQADSLESARAMAQTLWDARSERLLQA